MTSISIEALKGKTIREIQELIKQAESLPENHAPASQLIKTGQGGSEDSSARGREKQKPQTAQELLEEIENEN